MGKSMMSMMTGLAVVFVAGLSVGWAQQATVKLLSPKDGEATGPNLLIQWEFQKAGDINHIHLYLDGRNPGPPFGTAMEITGLQNGPHIVRIVGANTRHQEVGPEASATVTVNSATPTTPQPIPRGSRSY
ncbi:hypothetical protein MELA_01438 [Candidatus Methylomirabilis lanthanidiphila]|uniref:Fibronectin type-III domain-containing protein n=1 Tax=Candidatus Methylomirabilis lanthanidiphila TaxID=2211376 RepID=A0A564ZIQ6_9BACT|nr:hypothetical protein [Candidatus Methylomirabilis lanthanidiphila]VUZ85063.1 hypothetical protein MELA_01438 [Candidatus Methylomirabilis lanthanidiphila]